MVRKARQPEQLSDEGKHFYDALNDESPLACVLIAVAALERTLMSMLQKFFITGNTAAGLFKGDGILGDFSSCAKIAYCLGFLHKKAYENLNTLGNIRNAFAHSHVPIDFSNPDIGKLCAQLQLPSICDVSDFYSEDMKRNPRFRFQMAAVWIWSRNVLTALGMEQMAGNKHPW